MRSPVVVGVVPGQSPAVAVTAAGVARSLGARLVCAHASPLGVFAPELRAQVAAQLDGQDVLWSIQPLTGDPAAALAAYCDKVDARLLVVGASPALGALLAEGHRPVMVVPTGGPA